MRERKRWSGQVASSRSRRKGAVATIGAFAVVGSALVAGSAPAAAATTFNPFDVNRGFTLVAQGDAHLNNGEIEGSIAAFESISTGNQNGYPVVHSAAGEADYTVPSIDDTPVRILADRVVGSGAFDVSNRDDSGTLQPDSDEATAVVKFVNIDGLTGSARGGGSGPAAGQDFLRITTADNGIIDLKTVPHAGSNVADYQTAESSVAAYFADLDDQVARANDCLAGMYGTDLVQQVTVGDEGGMPSLSGFATDKPNTIDYDAIAGKNIKMGNAGGYVPSAEAPLVIKVPAGTTTLGSLNFEGGLTPGVEYTLRGEVRTSPDGGVTSIPAVTASFTPAESSGSMTVEFVRSAGDVAAYAGLPLVVFEYLELDGEPVAEHADPEDQAQTFSVEDEPEDDREDVPEDKPKGEPKDDPKGEPKDDPANDDRDEKRKDGLLPNVGSSLSWTLLLGAGLLLAGGVALVAVRRRTHA